MQFQKGKQVKRHLCHQDQSSQKSFQQTILLYHMQKTTPLGCCIEEVEQISFFENTSPKAARAKFLGSDGLFCFLSICIFGSFMNPYAMITSPSELFRFRRFILLVLTKKVIFMGVISMSFFMDSQWKLRQQHDSNFLIERNLLLNKYQHQKISIKKSRTVRVKRI